MRIHLFFLCLVFANIPVGNLFCQTDAIIVSYKPAKAAAGKDGDQRVGLNLFRMAKPGKDGKDGASGVDLRINIYAVQQNGSTSLRLVCFVNNILRDSFFINPVKQQVKFIADGGDAGTGGKGATGVRKEEKKSAGPGGDGGNGGKGGKGGSIEVYFDSAAIAFTQCNCIVYSNDGGSGGNGGNGGYAGNGYSSDPQTGKGSEGRAGAHGDIGPAVFIKSMETNKILFEKNLYNL